MRDIPEGGTGPESRVVARRTPYEMVFIDGDFESNVFPRIRDEAAETGIDPTEPERFEFLSIAADVVRDLTPEGAGPEALDLYRLLLFHAYNFWRSGRRVFTLDTAAARFLVEAAIPLEGWSFEMPGDAVYLQLPANLFWSSITPSTPPEPIDGFFLTFSKRPDFRQRLVGHLEVLIVLGIHRSRAGFSVIPLSTEVGAGMEELWAAEPREDGDFHNVLPGGDISGLYSILTTTEVFKLIGRVFAHAARNPDALVEVIPDASRAEAEPPPSLLPITRIALTSPPDGSIPTQQ